MTPSVRLNVWKCFLTDCSKEIVSCLISHVHSSCEYFMDREIKRNKTTWVDHAISRHRAESQEYPSCCLSEAFTCIFPPPPLEKWGLMMLAVWKYYMVLLLYITKYQAYLNFTGWIIRTNSSGGFWNVLS